MKLTDKQAMVMLQVLTDAVKISHRVVALDWTYTNQTMMDILNDIMNQQSQELVELMKDDSENGEGVANG